MDRENYDVRPEFQAYDADGEAQLYMNTIIGLVYRCYQFDKFKPLFHAFQHQQKGELYSDLFWLGLEGVAYEKALKERPSPTPPIPAARRACGRRGSAACCMSPRRTPGRRKCWTP